MHPSQLAARRQVAENRIDAVISQLAERAGVDVPAQEPVRDQDARNLFRLEALADAIELIAASLLPETTGTPSSESSQGAPPAEGNPEVQSGGPLWTTGDAVGRLTVQQLTAEISEIEDVGDLEAVLTAEQSGKNRTGAISAIEARIAKLRGG